MRALLLFVAVLVLAPALASADALPECGPDERLETNPVEPGAMHHAGGQCVSASGGGCRAAAPASRVPSSSALLFALAGVVLVTRRVPSRRR